MREKWKKKHRWPKLGLKLLYILETDKFVEDEDLKLNYKNDQSL